MADAAIQTSFDACDNRDNKLKDALMSLINISNENESRLKALRSEHNTLRSDNDSHAAKMADENEKRKTEFKGLDEKQKSEAQARVMDLAKCDGKIDTEFKNRKEEVEQMTSWYDGENETRKVEIAELGKLLNKENEARKEAIDKLEAFVKSASVSAVGDLDARINAEAAAREVEDKALSDRIDSQVVAVREEKMAALTAKTEAQNNDRISDLENLRKQHAINSAYMEALAGKTMGVYFSAYRNGAYSGGGGENLTFDGAFCNAGSGLDVASGVFTCPVGKFIKL